MPGRLKSWSPRASTITLVVYMLVLAAGQFLHHDFACHENSRTHCPSCQIDQSAQKVDVGGPPLDVIDRFVGRIELRAATAVDAPFLSSFSDRAPPA
jgi:hypothetical protein